MVIVFGMTVTGLLIQLMNVQQDVFIVMMGNHTVQHQHQENDQKGDRCEFSLHEEANIELFSECSKKFFVSR